MQSLVHIAFICTEKGKTDNSNKSNDDNSNNKRKKGEDDMDDSSTKIRKTARKYFVCFGLTIKIKVCSEVHD